MDQIRTFLHVGIVIRPHGTTNWSCRIYVINGGYKFSILLVHKQDVFCHMVVVHHWTHANEQERFVLCGIIPLTTLKKILEWALNWKGIRLYSRYISCVRQVLYFGSSKRTMATWQETAIIDNNGPVCQSTHVENSGELNYIDYWRTTNTLQCTSWNLSPPRTQRKQVHRHLNSNRDYRRVLRKYYRV